MTADRGNIGGRLIGNDAVRHPVRFLFEAVVGLANFDLGLDDSVDHRLLPSQLSARRQMNRGVFDV
jgi:hypothetical protein